MIEDIILKKKKCSKCGNIQEKSESPISECRECNYRCVNGNNYWILREDYRSEEKVDELVEKFGLEGADDFSAGLSKIKKAVENYKSNESGL